MNKAGNNYERAFEAWLAERMIPYRTMDQSRRRLLDRHKIKTFDFAICPAGAGLTLVDIKGRLFKGSTLEGLKNLQNWVTGEDIDGLSEWIIAIHPRQISIAVFVFAYRLTQAEVETDGLELFEFEGQRYVFLLIPLSEYQQAMRPRSSRWQTVYIPAADFRKIAVPLDEWIEHLNQKVINE